MWLNQELNLEGLRNTKHRQMDQNLHSAISLHVFTLAYITSYTQVWLIFIQAWNSMANIYSWRVQLSLKRKKIPRIFKKKSFAMRTETELGKAAKGNADFWWHRQPAEKWPRLGRLKQLPSLFIQPCERWSDVPFQSRTNTQDSTLLN